MLNHWMKPLETKNIGDFFSDSFNCHANFPDLAKTKVAVFSKHSAFYTSVRTQLDKLYKHYNIEIVDIGTTDIKSASSVYQILSEIMDGGIIPIMLGATIDDFTVFCNALEKEERLHLPCHIGLTPISINNKTNIINLGYQRHIVDKNTFSELLSSDHPGLSLGALRHQSDIVEPIIRSCDYTHFDVSSVRKSDCTSSIDSLPTGLTSEEACKLLRYVGENDSNRLLSIGGSLINGEDEASSMLIAQLIWYYVEGFNFRKSKQAFESKHFDNFVVEMSEHDLTLEFSKSKTSGKWWLKSNDSNQYHPCAYSEYLSFVNNEIPDRILKLL